MKAVLSAVINILEDTGGPRMDLWKHKRRLRALPLCHILPDQIKFEWSNCTSQLVLTTENINRTNERLSTLPENILSVSLFHSDQDHWMIMATIQEFYSERSVFLTGASGFLGKQVLEKLLRSCNVKNAYVLVRPKKGKSTQDRRDELIKSEVSTVRNTYSILSFFKAYISTSFSCFHMWGCSIQVSSPVLLL